MVRCGHGNFCAIYNAFVVEIALANRFVDFSVSAQRPLRTQIIIIRYYCSYYYGECPLHTYTTNEKIVRFISFLVSVRMSHTVTAHRSYGELIVLYFIIPTYKYTFERMPKYTRTRVLVYFLDRNKICRIYMHTFQFTHETNLSFDNHGHDLTICIVRLGYSINKWKKNLWLFHENRVNNNQYEYRFFHLYSGSHCTLHGPNEMKWKATPIKTGQWMHNSQRDYSHSDANLSRSTCDACEANIYLFNE